MRYTTTLLLAIALFAPLSFSFADFGSPFMSPGPVGDLCAAGREGMADFWYTGTSELEVYSGDREPGGGCAGWADGLGYLYWNETHRSVPWEHDPETFICIGIKSPITGLISKPPTIISPLIGIQPGLISYRTGTSILCPVTVTAPTASLVANPTSIISGESSLLTWASTGATSCTGTNFSTSGATSGSVEVRPTATTPYTVTCTNSTQSAVSSVTVTVSALGSTLRVSCQPSPATGVIGQTVTWNSTVTGGSGSYGYSWSGTDGLSGSSNQVLKIYSTQGVKYGQLTVSYSPSPVTPPPATAPSSTPPPATSPPTTTPPPATPPPSTSPIDSSPPEGSILGAHTSSGTQSISTVCNGRICTSPHCDGNGAGGAGDTGGSGGVTITLAGQCTAGNFCRGADVYSRNTQCVETFVTACPVSCVNGACVSASTPEISLIATPPLIKRGGTCTLQVSAQNVQQCTLSGAGVQRVFTATGGIISTSQVITPPLVLTTPYTLSCLSLSGGTVTKKVDCKIAPKFEEF